MALAESAEPVTTSMRSSSTTLDDDIELAARVDVPVLITAESHGQRNACARMIHATGARARGPFVPFWSRGISGGGVAPAIVHALRRHFARARRGTLFIDDIATLPAVGQRMLLTLLDERGSSPVSSHGAHGPRAVRIITGTSRHLVVEHATSLFCERLFYRLNVVHLDFDHQPIAGKHRPTTRPPTSTRPPVVLLVQPARDDGLAMYAEFLGDHGLMVIPVSAASEALVLAPQADIVVTGMNLDDPMDGVELVSRLRHDGCTRSTPIVVLTACARPRDRERAEGAGCDVFLAKPCLPNELLGEVQQLLTATRSQTADPPHVL